MKHRTRGVRRLAAVAALTSASLVAGIALPSVSSAAPARPAVRPAVALNPADIPNNVDGTSVHLLKFGKLKPPPNRPDPGAILARLAAGATVRNAVTRLFPALLPIVNIYGAISTVTFISDLVSLAEGGSKSKVERFSGVCRDVWEVYAKVNLKSAGLSQSVDLVWESVSRARTSYVRAVFAKYFKRQPDCDEMRQYLGMLGRPGVGKFKSVEKWDPAWAREVLQYAVCVPVNPQGIRWSEVMNPNDAAGIRSFCQIVGPGQPDQTQNSVTFSYLLAETMTERCNSATLRNREYVRNRIQVSDPDGDIDDIKGGIGRPETYDDIAKWKLGRVVTHQTILAGVYLNPLGDPGLYVDQVNRSRTARDAICNNAGVWIQEPSSFYTLIESDRVLRNFFDVAASLPVGEDIVAQATGALGSQVNVWTAIAQIARPNNCGVDTRSFVWPDGFAEARDNGWVCDDQPAPGDPGFQTINALLRELMG